MATNTAFEVLVTYELEGEVGDAGLAGDTKDAGPAKTAEEGGAPKTLVVPFEPRRFEYQQYNKAFAACMGV